MRNLFGALITMSSVERKCKKKGARNAIGVF